MIRVFSVSRIIGSCLVIVAYFVLVHVNVTTGVLFHFIADGISMPYFIATKHWDIVLMLSFLLIVSLSKLL